MALAVAETLADGGVLLAEAGTGTGKTLAYLVPAILSGQRVLVSTGTKNLQEQIYFKDLPGPRARPRRALHGHLHEGPGELPVPAPARAGPQPVADRGARGDRALGRDQRHRRSRRARGPARTLAALERRGRYRRHVPGQRLPAVPGVLRHAHAPARRRLRPRHRQPSPALRRRRRPAELLRRGHSHLSLRGRRRGAPARGRGHAVLRDRRSATIGSTISGATSSAC